MFILGHFNFYDAKFGLYKSCRSLTQKKDDNNFYKNA